MSANSLDAFTIIFADPNYSDITDDRFDTPDPTLSFDYPLQDNIRTLSTTSISDGDVVRGLLYVPDLSSDECKNASAKYVSPNATRLSNLPNEDYNLVAIAPWFSPTCTQEYLASARDDYIIRGFVFYQPDNSTGEPPSMNDPSWGLGDGGQWKSQNNFPVYAVPGMSGDIIMRELALYSGNLTTVPHGEVLAEQYHPSDYARLWVQINTDSTNALPSLWVFLLIVLGLLIFIIGTTSLIMHWIQRKRRQDLQLRIRRGEVDLEALGIKRLTVPQEVLDKMPLYTYVSDPAAAKELEDGSSPRDSGLSPVPGSPDREFVSSPMLTIPKQRNVSAPVHSTAASTLSTNTASHAASYNQPTCAICLDDFEPGITIVRELPCRHIFHPECVDVFLRDNSSLCPMCKTSTLPKGYCPAVVTNAMVRRERLIQRMRARRGSRAVSGGLEGGENPSNAQFGAFSRRISSIPALHRAHIPGRRISSAPVLSTNGGIEMANATSPTVRTATPDCPPSTGTEAQRRERRREIARRRAGYLLGRNPAPPTEVVEAEENQRPGWKKVLRKVFPGFR